MYFTQEDYRKIEAYLKSKAARDTSFDSATTPLQGNETIVLVQGGKNVNTTVSDIVSQFFALGVSDFINVTDKYGISYNTLDEAIRVIPWRSRKVGQVITFLNEQGEWHLYQYQGKSILTWNNTTLWIDLLESRIVNSILPDQEDLTMTEPDADGNSYMHFKDKDYSVDDFSGLGRVYLRKNLQTLTDPNTGETRLINYLTQTMVGKENVIYHIQYDYNLNGQTIIIPEGCVLLFEGGSIKNGNITFIDTIHIGNPKYKSVKFSGTILASSIKLSDFDGIDIIKNINGACIIDGENIKYTGSITVTFECSIHRLNLAGTIDINTTQQVSIIDSIIESSNSEYAIRSIIDYSNLIVNNTKISSDGTSDMAIYTQNLINNWDITQCAISGFKRAGIYTINEAVSINVERCNIYNIGHEVKQTYKGAQAIKIGTNGTERKGSIVHISNNSLKDIFTPYLTDNDATECHGILVYSDDVVIEGNVIENLYGVTAGVKSVLSGTEHEGIYVKGSNPTIRNNRIINACGNVSSDGAIAVKWNGVGGIIEGNYIEHYGGYGIYTQLQGVVISNNTVIIKDYRTLNEPTKGAQRVAGIYCNTVDWRQETELEIESRNRPIRISGNLVTVEYSPLKYPIVYVRGSITDYIITDNILIGKSQYQQIVRFGDCFTTQEKANKIPVRNYIFSNNTISSKICDYYSIFGANDDITGGDITIPLSIKINNNTFEIERDQEATTGIIGNFMGLQQSTQADVEIRDNTFAFSKDNIGNLYVTTFLDLTSIGKLVVKDNIFYGRIKYVIETSGAGPTPRDYIISGNTFNYLEYIHYIKVVTSNINSIKVINNSLYNDSQRGACIFKGISGTNVLPTIGSMEVGNNPNIYRLSTDLNLSLTTFTTSCLITPVPEGVTIKNPYMGFEYLENQSNLITFWDNNRSFNTDGTLVSKVVII